MAMLDEIVSQVGQRFGLHDKAGSLISLLLSLIVDPKRAAYFSILSRYRLRLFLNGGNMLRLR